MSTTTATATPTLDEFKAFFHAKAFDVIGNGAYRKHLSRCRDAGDPWAVTMGNHIQTIATHIREVQAGIAAMPKTQDKLSELCRDVSMSAQPPIRLFAGSAECCITRRRCTRCLDLSKSHKGTQNLFVDLRFTHFFLSLWFVCKLEYITRSITRTWIDAHASDTETFSVMCDTFVADQAACVEKMHKLFCVAKSHVMLTFANHAKTTALEPVLLQP